MRILSLNVWGGMLHAPLLDYLDAVDADIYCLQEVPRRLMHPNAVILIKFSGRAVPDRVVEAVWGFFGIYLLTFCVLFVALLLAGLDFLSGFSAVAACLNNVGPGLGAVATHYAEINDTAKWILCVAMLLGRLEIFTLLVLFTPMFWRH